MLPGLRRMAKVLYSVGGMRTEIKRRILNPPRNTPRYQERKIAVLPLKTSSVDRFPSENISSVNAPHSWVRRAAPLAALGALMVLADCGKKAPIEEKIDDSIELLESDYPEARLRAMENLSIYVSLYDYRVNDPKSKSIDPRIKMIDPIINALYDSNSHVKESAVRAINEIVESDMHVSFKVKLIDPLLTALCSRNEAVGSGASRALWGLTKLDFSGLDSYVNSNSDFSTKYEMADKLIKGILDGSYPLYPSTMAALGNLIENWVFVFNPQPKFLDRLLIAFLNGFIGERDWWGDDPDTSLVKILDSDRLPRDLLINILKPVVSTLSNNLRNEDPDVMTSINKLWQLAQIKKLSLTKLKTQIIGSIVNALSQRGGDFVNNRAAFVYYAPRSFWYRPSMYAFRPLDLNIDSAFFNDPMVLQAILEQEHNINPVALLDVTPLEISRARSKKLGGDGPAYHVPSVIQLPSESSQYANGRFVGILVIFDYFYSADSSYANARLQISASSNENWSMEFKGMGISTAFIPCSQVPRTISLEVREGDFMAAASAQKVILVYR